MSDWPKGPYYWQEGGTAYASIPFTWKLREVASRIRGDLFADKWVVGGPAVKLMPDFEWPSNVTVQDSYDGILQKINPKATRTTIGCPRSCGFCGVAKIEPEYKELDQWEDLPILCDNNLLAASKEHLECVFYLLRGHKGVDFNQGLDARLVTDDIASHLASLSSPIVRFSIDAKAMEKPVNDAVEKCMLAGCKRSWFRFYVLIGYKSSPAEDVERIMQAKKTYGNHAICPMWYHPLDCLQVNSVSEEQKDYGWNDATRIAAMRYGYGRQEKPELRES